MPRYSEKAEKITLPVLPLHDAVAFPSIPVDFETDDKVAVAAAEASQNSGNCVFLVCVAEDDGSAPSPEALCRTGTVARIRSSVRDGDSVRLICECRARADVIDYYKTGHRITADLLEKTVALADNGGIRGEAYCAEIRSSLERMIGFLTIPTSGIRLAARNIKDPALLSDFIASAVLVRTEDKQRVLEEHDPFARCALLLSLMESECRVMECEREIREKAGSRVARNQKEYYLREQMKVIEEELGEDADPDDLSDRIRTADIPEPLREKLRRENDRLLRTPYGSAEAAVSRNYIEEVLELPWNRRTKDRLDVEYARRVLDRDHDGLSKVKERILEYLAVKQLNPGLKNQIICLVGPPGTGKTSVAASIARAMNRKYVRVSLGGIHDEAEIRGHRKTYVASMPGRIINGIRQAGVANPLMLLDEIDKLASDLRGDPSSAMLEVLDPEQNKNFRDHFIEYPFDLSDCFFITTANTTDTIPKPLLDRMEVIELNGYTRTEKLSIARNHLLPKQLKRHGMSRRTVRISDAAILGIIDSYTREAGVRSLERNIAEICRKAARKIVESGGEIKYVTVNAADLLSYLGSRKVIPEKICDTDLIGVVNGLAYTETGGELLRVECAVLPGSGKLELTGSLGDVMKESAKAALTFVRSVAADYGIPDDFVTKKDIHLHFPEGAVPKDGPSAGVTVVTALVSALGGIPVARDVAMTGEVTLTGRVLAIGGLREKAMAAFAAGASTVLIPEDNLNDLEEIEAEVRKGLTFIPCRTVSDVLLRALAGPAPARAEQIPAGAGSIALPQMSVPSVRTPAV
jgi:ATP-dependent Lon protease